MTAIRFTFADLHASGLNCGPASLAAICGLTLDEVRVHFPSDDTPPLIATMLDALDAVGCQHRQIWRGHDGRCEWPDYGLARIQFEGPWTLPVPATRSLWKLRTERKYSHWVGVRTLSEQVSISGERDLAIWDINAFQDPCNGWLEEDVWRGSIVPALTADIPRATGGWHITHAIEVGR